MSARFVKLTGFVDYAATQPTEVWANPDKIAYFKPAHLGNAKTSIFFAEDGTLDVAESPLEVLVALRWCGLELAEQRNGHDEPHKYEIEHESGAAAEAALGE
jgi:hypothetical protein